MEVGIILLAVGFLLLGGSALGTLNWAARDGQLQNLSKGAKVIFDEEEPIGEATDCFPDEKSHREIKKLQKP